jgi:hypothetical protein
MLIKESGFAQFELITYQFVIAAFLGSKGSVVSYFGNGPLVKHNYLMGIYNGT